MSIRTLPSKLVIDIHDDVLESSPGLKGIAGNKSLESALNRIEFHQTYGKMTDLFEIAALLTEALAQGHVFLDGNKRTAFLSVITFLEYNGFELQAPEDTADIIEALAEKKLSHKKFAQWLEKHSKKIT